MSNQILVNVREKSSRAQLKQLRKAGRIPAVVFGAGSENATIDVPKKEYLQWLKTGGGSVVYLQVNNEDKVPVLLEDMQRHPVTGEVIHIDFLRVNAKEEVRTRLPIVFTGTPIGTKEDGIIQTDSTSVEVTALPHLIPASLTVDISGMKVSDTIQASDLKLPEGVQLTSSPNEYLVSIVASQVAATVVDGEEVTS